jgi:hypothetical protein
MAGIRALIEQIAVRRKAKESEALIRAYFLYRLLI